MKKTALLILLTAAVLGCVWLLWKPEQPTLDEAALSTPPVVTTRQTVPIVPANPVGSSSSDTKSAAGVSMPLHQAWIDARAASVAITQSVDPVTDEPVGTIKVGSASGSLGETPPFYRLQLKTAKHPILLGEKDTRHHFVRRVDSVHAVGGEVTIVPEIAVSYPRSASVGGLLFKRDDTEISRIGIIVPQIRVPPGDDASATQLATSIRVGNHELSAEDLAKATSQPIGSDTVLVVPTQTTPLPTTARVLWLALDANGSFAVAHNR